MSRKLVRLAQILLGVTLVVACGETVDTSAEAPVDIPVTTASTATPPPATESTTTLPAVTSTTAAPASGPIGQPFALWVPQPSEGAIIGVVGVSHDDVLNVRSGPSSSFDAVATLEPAQMGIMGTGEGWQVPSGSVWWRIEVGGVKGWANQRYLSRLGGVDDVTSLVVGMLGEVPSAETMTGLGATIAAAFGEVDDGSNVVVSVAPTQGDLGEVTYDVNGLSDDSVGGYRFHIFGQPTDGGGFSLMTVEATVMCLRGVSGDLCV